MSQASKRDEMPETARWIDRMRKQYGPAYVNGLIRRATATPGEPGLFYAVERGHVLGTPFPATSSMAVWQSHAIAVGCTFAGFIAKPGEAHGPD